jgi:hypothetical protein
MLAWRLADAAGVSELALVTGAGGVRDATAVSGGVVRCYEADPAARALAIESLAELLGSPVLRELSGYRPAGFCYVAASTAGLAAAADEIDAVVADSVGLVTGSVLPGWVGLPAGTVAIQERLAGLVQPARWRRAVLADLRGRRRVTVRTTPGPLDGYDRVVFATGAWTAQILHASGFPADGYRTKTVQYAVYQATGAPPVGFVDELTGLYGRPVGDNALLLGLPTDNWSVHPDSVHPDFAGQGRAERFARSRFPALWLGVRRSLAVSADCYTDPPVLQLRAVPGSDQRFQTFTGGSGGAVKSVLAASRRAASELVDGAADLLPPPCLFPSPLSGRSEP